MPAQFGPASPAFCRAEIAPAPSRATFEFVINRNQMCAKLRTLPNRAKKRRVGKRLEMVEMSDMKSFLHRVCNNCANITNRPTEELGFNPFILMSDCYRRENFHSDILYAILSPRGSSCSHKEGNLFLQSFWNLLIELCKERNDFAGIGERILGICSEDNISVTREEGRTDIALYHNTQNWVVIIENKINNAEDMHRQIPRYVEYWQTRQKETIAVIYVTPTGSKTFPSTSGWSAKEVDEIRSLLIPVPGYIHNSTKCLFAWLKRCEWDSVFFNNKAVFAQYTALVKKQAGDIMNDKEIESFLIAAQETGIAISRLQKILSGLPAYYATKIKNLLADNEIFPTVWVWSHTVTVLDGFTVRLTEGNVTFAIDIHCESFAVYGISLFVRSKKTELDDVAIMKKFEPVLAQHGFAINEEIWNSRYLKQFDTYPSMAELEQIAKDTKLFIKALSEARI